METYLYETEYQPERGANGVVRLVVVTARRAAVEGFLDYRLKLARTNPTLLAKIVEEECLRGLSQIGRESGPEHSKQTGRNAGGGTLTKGS